MPGERFQGALYGVKEAVIASNAWLLATYLDPARVHLAAGILFAHDFLAQGIEIDGAPGTSATMPAGAAALRRRGPRPALTMPPPSPTSQPDQGLTAILLSDESAPRSRSWQLSATP